jgi:predicted Holliday junction resolvase-like endonuclease
MSEQLGFAFLFLFVLAVAASIYLSVMMSRRVQAGINRWRDEERLSLETHLRELANADARIQIERWKQQQEQAIRLDAIQRSSAVTRGKVTEHIVPYLPGFDLDPKDIRFLGTPIDLIAFKGLNASSEEIEIVFIEVKTGRSALSARERAVKKAVEQKKVSWRVFHPSRCGAFFCPPRPVTLQSRSPNRSRDCGFCCHGPEHYFNDRRVPGLLRWRYENPPVMAVVGSAMVIPFVGH